MAHGERSGLIGRLTTRTLGLVLLGYGILGCIFVLLTLIVLGGSLSRVARLSDAVGGPLRSTATTLGDASDAFDGFGDSLTQAQRSSANAAQLATDTSQTMANLASAMTLQIFGTQPLLPLAEQFQRSSEQLTDLSGDLQEMSEALGQNVADVERAGSNLADVRSEVEELRQTLGVQDGGDGSGALGTVALYGLLLWLAVPAVASAVIGLILLRRAPPA